MKKVITLVLVVFYASITFAQDSKMQEAPVKHMEGKESKDRDLSSGLDHLGMI